MGKRARRQKLVAELWCAALADDRQHLKDNLDTLHRQYATLSDAHHQQGKELAGLVETIAEMCPYSVLLPPKENANVGEFGEHEGIRGVNLLKRENLKEMLSWGLAGNQRVEPWACIPYRRVELRLVEIACESEPIRDAIHMLVKIHGTAVSRYAISRSALEQMRSGRVFSAVTRHVVETLWGRLREAINGPWR